MQAWPWAAAPPQPEISSKVEAWDSGQGHGLEYLSGHVGVRAAEAMRVPEFVEPESEAELSEAPRPPSSGSGAAGGASAQEIPDSPPIVGPFFRQPSHPPYLLPPGAPGEALVNDVLGLTEALRIANALRSAAAGRAALAERLALTLSDARLLCSHLFRTMRGRMNARRALAALRASHDPRLARGVLQALVAALQHAGPAPFSAEEAETVIDHATALLLTGTVEMPRASEDLFALDWDLTSRLLGRVQQLANEHADSPGPLRPKAILLHASALDRFEKKEEAIGHYFEAWSELQKRHMTPSPMEAALIPALAELQYGTQQIRLGLHIAEKCYALRGESTEAVVSQVIVLHAQLTACRVVSDAAGSCALSSRAVDAARSLGPGHELLLARILHVHATDLVVTGRLFAHERVRQEALRLLVSLDDPSLPDLDWMGHQETKTMIRTMRPSLRVRVHSAAIRAVRAADPEERTPMLAHQLVRRALALRDDGKTSPAVAQLASALRTYRTKFGNVFTDEHPRIRRLEAVLAELRATAPERPPPLAWRRLLRLPVGPARGSSQVAPEASASSSSNSSG